MTGYRYPFTQPHPVSSPYGPRGGGFHYGTDFAWLPEEGPSFPIVAAADGYVHRIASEEPGAGLYLILEHAGPEWSVYMHLAYVQVQLGQTVTSGQQIAMSGQSGGVDPHLHFEIHSPPYNKIDPEPLLSWPILEPEPLELPEAMSMVVLLCEGFPPLLVSADGRKVWDVEAPGTVPHVNVNAAQRAFVVAGAEH
jgi:murein DD-endopeptidase MepM/ murein hydrolase activator NlpD